MNGIVIGVLGYVAVQLVVGLMISRGIRSEEDYLLAGRRLGYPLAIFSIFATLAQQHLGTVAYVIFAGALVSAILSTVDSNLLSASSLASHNLVLRLRPGASERTKVRTARIGVVVAGLVAYALAFGSEGVYRLVEEASAFGGAGFLW